MINNRLSESTIQPGFFTIDVEDYYHIIGVSGTPAISTWDALPSRVDYGMKNLYDLLDRHQVKATLFFLGYVARKLPHLVKEAASRGHEVASHGMYHQEVRSQTRLEFLQDAQDSKKVLEDLISEPVLGWRSAGFSMNQSTPWFFDSLLEAGYLYDSSIVPNRSGHKRLFAADSSPSCICTANGKIYEFPICVADVAGTQVSMFGGGYLRFFSKSIVRTMAIKTLKKRPLLIYIHPREMDPKHPRIEMNLFRKFKSYINMDTVSDKLELLLCLTQYQRLRDYYETNADNC